MRFKVLHTTSETKANNRWHFSKGEKVRIKAHGGPIDVQGVTVATVNEKVQLQKVETWFDPLEMFRQMVRCGGVVTKESVTVPADAGRTEQNEATPTVDKNETIGNGISEAHSSPEKEIGNTEAVNVAVNTSIENTKISHTATNGGDRPSEPQPEEDNTDSAIALESGATSHPSQPQSETTASDVMQSASMQGDAPTIRTEVIPPEDLLGSVQTVAEKELDLSLAEDKGKQGVYESSGCPFLVTMADQTVLNRE